MGVEERPQGILVIHRFIHGVENYTAVIYIRGIAAIAT